MRKATYVLCRLREATQANALYTARRELSWHGMEVTHRGVIPRQLCRYSGIWYNPSRPKRWNKCVLMRYARLVSAETRNQRASCQLHWMACEVGKISAKKPLHVSLGGTWYLLEAVEDNCGVFSHRGGGCSARSTAIATVQHRSGAAVYHLHRSPESRIHARQSRFLQVAEAGNLLSKASWGSV